MSLLYQVSAKTQLVPAGTEFQIRGAEIVFRRPPSYYSGVGVHAKRAAGPLSGMPE